MNTGLTHYEVHAKLAAYRTRSKWRKFLEGIPEGERWKAFPMAVGAAVDPKGNPYPAAKPEEATALLMEMVSFLLSKQKNPYSYGAVSRTGDFNSLVDFIIRELRWHAADITTSMILTYHMVSHERAGRRVYAVSEALAEQLQHTELRGLLTDDLRLPFENVLIQVPARLDIQVWNKDTGWHRLRDVYITEDDHVGHESDGMGVSRGWRILLCGETKSGDIGDDALSHFWITLPPGEKLDDQLDKLQRKIAGEDASEETFGPMMDKWRPIFTWLMNVVLYATWSDPGERIMANREARQLWNRIEKMPKNDKRKALQTRFQNLEPQRRIVLGGNVRIQRGGSDADDGQGGERGGAAGGSQVWVRTRVSGHWRNQPHGPERSLRKLIWIQPFWRGPEDAPVSTPRHEVG